MWHSLVFSAAERESAYVIDGLMRNDVVKTDIHSTDSHGYVRPEKSLTMTVAPKLLGMRPAVLPAVPYSDARDEQLSRAKLRGQCSPQFILGGSACESMPTRQASMSMGTRVEWYG